MLAPALLALLQQGNSSPPDGDTTAYWQQRVAYTITAQLDERTQRLVARGTLVYVNNSPDTLREMYVHQYLNAFRPGSAWSRDDEREGRERFQHLRDPDFGYERFTAPPRVDGLPVRVEYPGAPDSTVARFALPSPLAPGDSLRVEFDWAARPSTYPRRQGRRGRSWDFAQWYPKVAVYDRAGWEFNALRPAGEFYGEYGDYDVTLVVADEQVIGATGVPVEGDPGWNRTRRDGVVRIAANAYDHPPISPRPSVPDGMKAVRFVARDVHHFAWSTSPDYRYEGGVYVRTLPSTHWRTWDTVSVHVLYRPSDDTTWGGQRVVRRTIAALRWLESIYGPYAYPQMTALHRLDGGGTEFPMMMMNGSPSQGLILHEGGHVFTYGILGNNEWRSGWMDEGLTSYQTDWALGSTAQERQRAGNTSSPLPATGYRSLAATMTLPRDEGIALDQAQTDLQGDAQPIGTIAHEFRDFNTYNDMIYTRAQVMYGQLRDVLGDSAFREFLKDYYSRWALKHVDERAMQASAARKANSWRRWQGVDWFFREWVHETGVTDYAVDKVERRRENGAWVTIATLRRRGEYRHPMNVGVRTVNGWTTALSGDARGDKQVARIVTPDEPLEVRLDPFHYTWDWDRRNDVPGGTGLRTRFDWPFLTQADRERSLLLVRPTAWYSDPAGAIVGGRVRTNYLGWLDERELGLAVATRSAAPVGSGPELESQRVQGWLRLRNPYLPFLSRPAVGWSVGAAWLDDIAKGDVQWRVDRSMGQRSTRKSVALNFANATAHAALPELWSSSATLDVRGAYSMHATVGKNGSRLTSARVLVGGANLPTRGYAKAEVSAGWRFPVSSSTTLGLRSYDGVSSTTIPLQRALYVSADDPLTTFDNNWWRPAGSLFKRSEHWLPLGGAALRGYDWSLNRNTVTALNAELVRQLGTRRGGFGTLSFALAAFGDGAIMKLMEDPADTPLETPIDAGVGLRIGGRLYDQPVTLRIDSPFFVSHPELAIDREHHTQRIAPRLVISFTDVW